MPYTLIGVIWLGKQWGAHVLLLCRLLLSLYASLFGNRAVPSQSCQLKIALRFLSKVSHGISGLAVQVFSFHWFTVLGFLLTKFTLGKSGQLGKLISSKLKDISSITLVVTMERKYFGMLWTKCLRTFIFLSFNLQTSRSNKARAFHNVFVTQSKKVEFSRQK